MSASIDVPEQTEDGGEQVPLAVTGTDDMLPNMAALSVGDTPAKYRGRHEDDTVGSLTAALARSALISKMVMMPKMKSVMMFQPEDHVSKAQVGRKLNVVPKVLQFSGMRAFQHGSIFCSGCLMFVGHEVALSALHEHEHHANVDTAPALLSGIAGMFGGSLYALTATPLNNYVRGASFCDTPALFKGLAYTLPRDVGGFGLYFGVYTATKKTLSVFETVEDENIIGGDYTYPDLARRLGCASVAGATAAVSTYCWRSPVDTLYKRSIGARRGSG
jgi:hypothetical protein